MGRRRGVLLLALVLVLAMVPLSHANACSCIANTDPRDRLAAAEGAFIGELVGRRETGLLGSIISSGRDVVYTFEVAEVFKGDLGQRVDVHSAAGGGSCGFEVAPGEAVGVLLYRHQGTWQSGLCGQIEPDKLRAAAAPLPAPDGQAPAAVHPQGGPERADQGAVLDQADVVDAAGVAACLVDDVGAEQLTQAHRRLRAGH